MPNTIHTWVRRCGMLWRWARGERAHRLTETVSGLPADLISDTARQIMRWSLPLTDTPVDALAHLLRDYGMPPYQEAYSQTLTRIKDFTDDIPFAGAVAMLKRQAVFAGLVNPEVVSTVASTDWCFTADNAGFQSRYGDPGLKWGEFIYGNFVEPSTANNIRNLLLFFRAARGIYTGVKPTYWQPSLFAPESWTEAKHGTAGGGTFSTFADQGTIGGNIVPVSTEPAEFDLLRSGSKLAVMTNDDLQHDKTANAFRGMNGLEDGFFWWAGTIDVNDTAQLCGTCNGAASEIGWRILNTAGTLTLTFANSSATLSLNNSFALPASGWYFIVVSIDTSLGSFGGVNVYINGVEEVSLSGNFAVAPWNGDPEAPLTIGDTPAGGTPQDQGDWQAFGWVRGRPAILPDITLLLSYYKAEISDDYDPATDVAATLLFDLDPEDSSALSLVGDKVVSYTNPVTGVPAAGIVFSAATDGDRPDLVDSYFAGGQDAIRAETGEELGNTGDAGDFGTTPDATFLYVVNADGASGPLLLSQSGTLLVYQESTGGFHGYHDGTALRETTDSPPTDTTYAASLVIEDSGLTGQFHQSGVPADVGATLTFDGTVTWNNTLAQLFLNSTDVHYGRFVYFSGAMTDDEVKQRTLALFVDYALPLIAS